MTPLVDKKFFFIGVYYILVNIFSLCLFFVDKIRAKKGKWRIPENQLFLTAFLGGGIGAEIGMNLFKHKTQKNLFKTLIPVSIGMHIYIIYTMLVK